MSAPEPSRPPPEGPSRIGAFVARHRRNIFLRKTAGACRRFLAWHNNANYEGSSNGEIQLLDRLSRWEPRVIVDAGANVGDWTLAAAVRCRDAVVHAFEISPPTFAALAARTADVPNVVANNVGLSDRAGTITIRHYPDLPALTTASDYPHPYPSQALEAAVTSGDAYAAARGIDHVDFLKIDVEGMEPAVLEGFSGLFGRRAIDLVQFEYGQVNVLSNFLLRDFHLWFESRGFVVGKIYPGYVDFRPYRFADEDFVGPNYLACLRARADWIASLAGSPAR